MPNIRIFVVILFVFLVFAPSGNAAVLGQQYANHLKAMFENGIAQYRESPHDEYGRMVFDGDVEVETTNSYYAVTLPFMTWQHEGWPDIKIGIIAVNVTPHQKEDHWNMAVALPSPIYAVDLQNNIYARLDIGQQSFTGTWNEAISGFENMKALYKDITLINRNNIITFRLPELSLSFNRKEKNTQNILTSLAEISLKNLEYIAPENSIFQFGLLHTKADIRDMPDNWLSESFYNSLMKSNKPFLYFLENPPSGVIFETEIENANIYTHGQTEKTASLERLAFKTQASDLRSNNSNLKTALVYHDLVSPFPVSALDITNINIDADISKIPLSQITSMVKNIGSNEAAGLSMMLRIPAMLSQAGTTVMIKNPLIKGPDYVGGMKAEIKTDLTALNSITVKGAAHVKGIDEFTQRISAYGDFFTSLMEGMKRFARKEKVKYGEEPIHYIDFSMDEAGIILINGEDIFTPLEAHTEQEKTELENTPKEKMREPEEIFIIEDTE